MKILIAAILSLAAGIAAPARPASRPGENLARGKPCRLKPRPNYRHCTDPGDATQWKKQLAAVEALTVAPRPGFRTVCYRGVPAAGPAVRRKGCGIMKPPIIAGTITPNVSQRNRPGMVKTLIATSCRRVERNRPGMLQGGD